MVKLLCGLLLVLGSATPSFVNPKFTPNDVQQAAETILSVKITDAAAGAKSLTLAVVDQPVKGTAPGKQLTLDFAAALANPQNADAVKAFIDIAIDNRGGPVLVALGKNNLLHINGKWARMNPGANATTWQFDQLDAELNSTFNGGTDMLLAAMRFMQKFPDSPGLMGIDCRVQWDSVEKIGELSGTTALIPVELDGALGLHAVSASGDKLWRQKGGALAEVKEWAAKSSAAAWADFTGDGRVDCAVLGEGHALELLAQDASGIFVAQDIALADKLDKASSLAVIALPPTGAPALVIGNGATPQVLKYSGGTFAAVALPAAEALAVGAPGPCVVGDFVGDSCVDILQLFEKNAVLYQGNGEGKFTATLDCGALTSTAKSRNVAVADFDGDGALDLYLTGGDAKPLVFENHQGTFRNVTRLTGEPSYHLDDPSVIAVVAGDYNNDGFIDLLGCYGSEVSRFFFNRGFRSFALAEKRRFDIDEVPVADKGMAAAVWADFDRDGSQDLAFALANGSVYLAKTTLGSMSKPQFIRVSLSPKSAFAGPLNVTFSRAGIIVGVRQATLHGLPALLGVSEGDTYTVDWQLPGAEKVSRTVTISEQARSAELVIGGDQ